MLLKIKVAAQGTDDFLTAGDFNRIEGEKRAHYVCSYSDKREYDKIESIRGRDRPR